MTIIHHSQSGVKKVFSFCLLDIYRLDARRHSPSWCHLILMSSIRPILARPNDHGFRATVHVRLQCHWNTGTLSPQTLRLSSRYALHPSGAAFVRRVSHRLDLQPTFNSQRLSSASIHTPLKALCHGLHLCGLVLPDKEWIVG